MNENYENEVIYEDGESTSEGLGLKAKLLMAAGGGLIAGAAAGFGFAKKKFDRLTADRIDKKIEKLEKKKEELLKEEDSEEELNILTEEELKEKYTKKK